MIYTFENLFKMGNNVNAYELDKIRKVYANALEYFPNFARLPIHKQIAIFEEGYFQAQRMSNRDIYVFAKYILIAMANATENGISPIGELRDVYDYHKVREQRMTRRNPDKPSEIWEHNSLIFVDYVYTVNGYEFRTSIHASDLWHFLARGYAEQYE